IDTDRRGRPRIEAIARLAAERGVPVVYVDGAALDAIADFERHQGVAAEARAFAYWTLDEVLDQPGGEPALYLVLDGVEDPHNFGAILRSADAAGVRGVVVPERRAAPVTPVVARASAGAIDHVAVAQVVNV